MSGKFIDALGVDAAGDAAGDRAGAEGRVSGKFIDALGVDAAPMQWATGQEPGIV